VAALPAGAGAGVRLLNLTSPGGVADVPRDRRLLLALDNREHVVAAALMAADLLAACPELAVLAISRVRLRLSGYREHAVPPLGLSGNGDDGDGGDHPAAVRLFVERARTVREDFVLTPITRRWSWPSAAASTACRSPSTSPPPGPRCCCRRRCSRGWTADAAAHRWRP